eukprot:742672-Heterocapsa_arctica.AAC.1
MLQPPLAEDLHRSWALLFLRPSDEWARPIGAGIRGSTSRIDHMLINSELRSSVERCQVLQSAGVALQAVAVRRRLDHFPVQMVIRFTMRPWSTSAPVHVWNKAALNECLQRGWNRRQVVEAVEQGIASKADEIARMLAEDGSPDRLNTLLINAVEAAASPILSTPPKPQGARKDDAELVRDLLQQRRDLRMRLGEASCTSDEEWSLSWRIGRISRRMKKEKQERLDADDEAIVEEMWQARKSRRHKEVWQLARRLSRTGMGKQGRSLRLATPKVDPMLWVERLQLSGNEGGVSGKVVQEENEERETDPSEPLGVSFRLPMMPTEEDFAGAREDLKMMRSGAWRMRTWRAGVDWSVPVEMLRILLFPGWQYIRNVKLGVGFSDT